jgi:tetratricopeptide (TPR) repeat protein
LARTHDNLLIMPAALSVHEESQLAQTIEMFEVITQTQPLDYQSLEILKEAYLKLGRHQDVLTTSRRIASAYVQLGQLSSAILEYESILQAYPGDPEVQAALAEIEQRATSFPAPAAAPEPVSQGPALAVNGKADASKSMVGEIDDGREAMYKIFVEGRHISAGDFDLCWPKAKAERIPGQIVEPFVQMLAQRQLLTAEKSLKLICEQARLAYLLIDKYDVDVELARSFPREVCQRWCILPFDRMSKSLLIATVNPFNRQALREVEKVTKNHVLWYVAAPQELVRTIRKIFR